MAPGTSRGVVLVLFGAERLEATECEARRLVARGSVFTAASGHSHAVRRLGGHDEQRRNGATATELGSRTKGRSAMIDEASITSVPVC